MTNTRTRLLTYTAVALTSSIGFASSAQAACTLTTTANANDTWLCGNTTTTNTTGAGGGDREFLFSPTTVPTFLTVPAGVTANGYGLAWTPGVAGTQPTTVTNNGTIQVDVGLVPTAGGNGALSITSIGSPVTYVGTGNIINLGVGNGLDVNLSGTASFTGTVGGNVTSGTGAIPSGVGILVDHLGTSGNVAVTTTAGRTIQADHMGIGLNANNLFYTGTLTINNNATIASLTSAPGTLDYGMYAQSSGTGAVTVTNGA